MTAVLWVLGSALAVAAYFGLGSVIGRRLARCQPAPPPDCCQHCGLPLPSNRISYCTRACRWADDNHGPNGDDQ